MQRGYNLEKAVFISTLGGLKHLRTEYSRVYFGNEFCQRLTPTVNELKQVMCITKDKQMGFTLVTPYVTNEGLRSLRPLFDLLKEQKESYEVVVNDWGVLKLLNEEYQPLQPVLGRLLNRMKRGPEIINVIQQLPQPALRHFKDSNVSLIWFRRFLSENRVRRVDFDNLIQGIEVNLKSGNFPMSGSLYFPYLYVTTTRTCLVNGCDTQIHLDKVGIFPCQKECRKYTFYLKNPDIPVTLILKGNTQFFINDKLPENLESIGIDRIVEQPEIPM